MPLHWYDKLATLVRRGTQRLKGATARPTKPEASGSSKGHSESAMDAMKRGHGQDTNGPLRPKR